MNKKYDIKGAYDRVCRLKGSLPTVREVAQESGAKVGHVRKVLNWNGMPFEHIKDPGPSAEAKKKMREKNDAIFREKHAQLTQRLGRYPTRSEMNRAIGYAGSSTQAGRVAQRLHLPMSHPAGLKDGKMNEKGVLQTREHVNAFTIEQKVDKSRIMQIREGNELGEGQEANGIPGDQYAPSDRILLTCPVCSEKKMIAPRMHPFWLRNAKGQAVFVCSRPCTGQNVIQG